jgi:hypothetical protein
MDVNLSNNGSDVLDDNGSEQMSDKDFTGLAKVRSNNYTAENKANIYP